MPIESFYERPDDVYLRFVFSGPARVRFFLSDASGEFFYYTERLSVPGPDVFSVEADWHVPQGGSIFFEITEPDECVSLRYHVIMRINRDERLVEELSFRGNAYLD